MGRSPAIFAPRLITEGAGKNPMIASHSFRYFSDVNEDGREKKLVC